METPPPFSHIPLPPKNSVALKFIFRGTSSKTGLGGPVLREDQIKAIKQNEIKKQTVLAKLLYRQEKPPYAHGASK